LPTAVAIICGGQSPEHDISLMSAKNILNSIDKKKFSPQVIYIEKNGCWRYAGDNLDELTSQQLPELCIIPGHKNHCIAFKDDPNKKLLIDIAFPVLHGPLGEDGTIQGLFRLCGLPFVGSNVLGSAISMDKDVIKRLLRDAGIRVPKFLVFHQHEKDQINFTHIISQLTLPIFIKPTNAGSSIGITKVKTEIEFQSAIDEAFRYDEKIIIEEGINGREIECAVLGNENPSVALPGEIVPHHEFYTYTAKYFDANGASVIVPAELDKTTIHRFQEISLLVFKALCCSGMVRVDFFYTSDGTIYVNEINTIPGFTNISMYPKCWIASGISYTDLIEQLIMLGLKQRHYAMAI
jgi:D-alanine-D-alanine ligase